MKLVPKSHYHGLVMEREIGKRGKGGKDGRWTSTACHNVWAEFN
jgi:hypothetical protein